MKRYWADYFGQVMSKVIEIQDTGLKSILDGIVRSGRRVQTKALDAETAYKRLRSFYTRLGAQGSLGTLDKFRTTYSRNKNLKNVVSYIDKVETDIETVMAPRERLQSLISKMFSGEKEVRLSDNSIQVHAGAESTITLAALSSGEKQVLRILIECLYAEDTPLWIDEPEISLHIDWQKDLVSAMRSVNPDAQLIMATHSPEIMADLEDAKIFRV